MLDKNNIPVTVGVAHDDYTSTAMSHHFTSKVTHLINDKNRHSLVLHGAPTQFDGVRENPFDPNSQHLTLNGDPDTFAMEQWMGSFDAIYNYNGKFKDDKLRLEAWIGYHQNWNKFGPSKDLLRDLPAISWEMPMDYRDFQAEESGLPEECQSAMDLDSGSRCRVSGYRTDGFSDGLIRSTIVERVIEKTAVTYLLDFAGLHQLKTGLDFEQNFYYDRKRYAGNGVYHLNDGSEDALQPLIDAPEWESFLGQHFFSDNPDDPMSAWEMLADQRTTRTQSRNYALFAQDSWNPTNSLTINYGLRWEAQQMLANNRNQDRESEEHLTILDNFAPRVGMVWDFLGGGRSRLYGHWGRFYESIPLDIADRAFTQENIGQQVYSCLDENGALPIDELHGKNPPTDCMSLLTTPDGVQTPFTRSTAIVAPGLKGQYSDEAILGVEVELMPSWVFGVSGIYRNLGRVIEDISTDGGATFLIANPGDFDLDELDELDRQIARETDPEERARLQTLRAKSAAINDFPEPRREFWGLQCTLDKKFSDRFLVRGSYLLSWVLGNYSGLFSDSNFQLDPNYTSLYDLPRMMVNRDGPLPSDRRHRFKVDGYYQHPFSDTFIGIVGLSGRLQSGKPIEVLGSDPKYGPGEVFLLARGEGGRTPWVWAADLHVAVRYNVDESLGAEFFIDIFNVSNNRETVDVDQLYTYDVVAPIEGGTMSDLEHARNAGGGPINKNSNYKEPTRYQAPLGGQIGLRLFF